MKLNLPSIRMRSVWFALLFVIPFGAAHAQPPAQCEKGDLCICTGSPTGNYQAAGEAIAKQLGVTLQSHIKFVNTNGSLDNLNYLSDGRCNIGIAQSNVYDQWRTEATAANNVVPVQDLYSEYVHVLCPANPSLSDMDALAAQHATLIIGPPGSGTAETWRSLRQVDEKKYGNANIDVSGDPADAGSVQTVKASYGKSHPVCMLWISGLNSTAIQNANDRSWDPATNKPKLQLISVNDKRMLKLPGREGPQYTVKTITPAPAAAGTPGFYDHLINNGGYFSSASIDVLSVQATMVFEKPSRHKSLVLGVTEDQPTTSSIAVVGSAWA